MIRKLSTCKKWHCVLIVLQSRTELNKRGVLQTSENPQVSVHEVVLWIPFVLFSINNHQRFCDGFGGFTECHLSSWRKKRITRLWLIWPTLDAKIFFALTLCSVFEDYGFFLLSDLFSLRLSCRFAQTEPFHWKKDWRHCWALQILEDRLERSEHKLNQWSIHLF